MLPRSRGPLKLITCTILYAAFVPQGNNSHPSSMQPSSRKGIIATLRNLLIPTLLVARQHV
eukprot:10695528-Karenia_brevis.AAC.1